MKLTVYDDLPATPLPPPPSQISKLVSHGRRSMSRASTRASISARRRANSKPSISKPLPVVSASDLPLRRNPSFRPLQLSIYMPEQRLSDLPSFDRYSFTEEGDIKPPPRALIRTKSEEFLRPRSPIMPDAMMPGKPASMFEQSLSRRMSHVRKDTESTVISTSRPPSEYDALHSHPVSWYSMPGLPPQIQMAAVPNHSRTVLSPMQEEFTPPPSGAVLINGKILAFPDIDAARVQTEQAYSSLLPPAPGQESESACPSPIIDPGPNRRTTIITMHKSKISQAASILLDSIATTATPASTAVEPRTEQPRPYFHMNYTTNNRINQWLEADQQKQQPIEQVMTKTRSRDSSISTVKSTTTISTTSSFAEHRRKRSEFYQLNKKPSVAVDTAATSVTTSSSPKAQHPPTPLRLYKPFPTQTAVAGTSNAQLPAARLPTINTTVNDATHVRSKSSLSLKNATSAHSRTMTASTVASTVATDVLFEDPETPEDHLDAAQAILRVAKARGDDAESMTTVDMKSRTGTMKSTITSASRVDEVVEMPISLEKKVVAVEQVAHVQNFNFRNSTPSPLTPGRQCADVEKMMFEMCAQSGYRRVNVGVAF